MEYMDHATTGTTLYSLKAAPEATPTTKKIKDEAAVEHARAAVRPQRSQRRAPTQHSSPSQCFTLSRRVVVQDSGKSEQSHLLIPRFS
jgi:hypothetical protein